MAKCPKCGKDVAPKKSWKMAGRPDKAGKRMERAYDRLVRVLWQNL